MDRAALLLLDGFTGINISEIGRALKLANHSEISRMFKQMREHVDGGKPCTMELRHRLFNWMFREMNANVLLSSEDKES